MHIVSFICTAHCLASGAAWVNTSLSRTRYVCPPWYTFCGTVKICAACDSVRSCSSAHLVGFYLVCVAIVSELHYSLEIVLFCGPIQSSSKVGVFLLLLINRPVNLKKSVPIHTHTHNRFRIAQIHCITRQYTRMRISATPPPKVKCVCVSE